MSCRCHSIDSTNSVVAGNGKSSCHSLQSLVVHIQESCSAAKMSTSTLGGFESDVRKQLFDEYLFQRRVLFGLSLSIVFMVFIWTVAICSDHWIIVASDVGKYCYTAVPLHP